jgi:hypothetical protein
VAELAIGSRCTYLGKVEQQGFHGRQHLHHTLDHLAPGITEGNVVYRGHVKLDFTSHMAEDGVVHCRVREVDVGGVLLQRWVVEVLELLGQRALDLGVVF